MSYYKTVDEQKNQKIYGQAKKPFFVLNAICIGLVALLIIMFFAWDGVFFFASEDAVHYYTFVVIFQAYNGFYYFMGVFNLLTLIFLLVDGIIMNLSPVRNSAYSTISKIATPILMFISFVFYIVIYNIDTLLVDVATLLIVFVVYAIFKFITLYKFQNPVIKGAKANEVASENKRPTVATEKKEDKNEETLSQIQLLKKLADEGVITQESYIERVNKLIK